MPYNGGPLPASPGIAIGPALLTRSADVDVPDEAAEGEIDRVATGARGDRRGATTRSSASE